jgi:hypothetical protein
MDKKDMRGRAGTGAILSLSANGMQDSYLTNDKSKDSFFKYKNMRHSNFAKFSNFTLVTNPNTSPTWPFDNTVIVTLNPQTMGDLLCNMFIKCKLPLLSDRFTRPNFAKYCDQIGRALIEKIEFRVDENVLEIVENDWGIIHDELFFTSEDQTTNKALINGGQNKGELPDSIVGAGPIELYIPLKLFFGRKHVLSDSDNSLFLDNFYEPYFPICSIYHQNIQLRITFKKQTFFTGTNDVLSLPHFTIVTEEISVSAEERVYLQSKKHSMMIETIIQNPTLAIPTSSQEADMSLTAEVSIKAFFYFFRKEKFEQDGNSTAFLNRYNYSSSDSTDINTQTGNPVMSDAIIILNGVPLLGKMDNNKRNNVHTDIFYKTMIPFQSGMTCGLQNIYMYSFSLKPKDPAPTGSLNFGLTKIGKNRIKPKFISNLNGGTNDDYVMHVYAQGYRQIEIENGKLRLL